MRVALCKITHFVLLQIFSEWQPIDSTQQDAFLSSWHYGAQAVGQSHNTVSDEMAPKPSPFTFPLPPCLFLSHLLFLLNTPLKLKASLVLRSRCRLKDIFFLLHLSEEMSLLLALVGTGLLQLSSTESRYSMWVPVLNIAILPDSLFPPVHRRLLSPSVSSALQWNELPWLILQLIPLLLSPQREEARMSEAERRQGGVGAVREKSKTDRATPEGWVSCDKEWCPLPLPLSLPSFSFIITF